MKQISFAAPFSLHAGSAGPVSLCRDRHDVSRHPAGWEKATGMGSIRQAGGISKSGLISVFLICAAEIPKTRGRERNENIESGYCVGGN